jgi:3-oxoacyl-[acyl-carrier protein] reductase
MDLGIRGKIALVCGASRGLGYACAMSLAREGCAVSIVARDAEKLERAAAEISSATGATVRPISADITSEEGRATALAAAGNIDILVTNAGGPPTGDFRQFSREDWLRALNANMLTPIDLIRLTVDGMIARKFGRIVNITSGAVKAPINVLGLSNGARSGLTGFIAGISRDTVKHNVTINNLLPGAFATERLSGLFSAQGKARGMAADAVAEERRKAIPAGRFGDPAEFGEACAYLCSAQSGYITGQNFLIDGGSYPGTF